MNTGNDAVVTSYAKAPTHTVTAGDVAYAYRELPIAKERHVIAFDNRGVGASTGTVPDTVEAMTADTTTFITARGRNTAGERAARAFVARLDERTDDRDAPVTIKAFQTQLKAIKRWGRSTPADLSTLNRPTSIANGDHDRMVPSNLSEDLRRRIPGSELIIFPDSGHGGIFQHHDTFAPAAVEFLTR